MDELEWTGNNSSSFWRAHLSRHRVEQDCTHFSHSFMRQQLLLVLFYMWERVLKDSTMMGKKRTQEAPPGLWTRGCSWRGGHREIGFWRLPLPVPPPLPPAQAPVSYTGLLQSHEHNWLLPAFEFLSLIPMLLSSLHTSCSSLSWSPIQYPLLRLSYLKSSSLPSFMTFLFYFVFVAFTAFWN